MTRRTRTAAIVAAALVALAVIIWVASSGGNPPNQAATGSESAQDRSSPSTATATATSDYAPAPSEAPVTDLPVQLEPVPLDETAQFGDQVSAELVDLVAVEAEGQVPGEVSGPALRVTVRLINGTSQPLALDAVTVFLYFGPDLTPAPQIGDDDGDVFRGSLPPGDSAQASYTFSVAENERDDISVTVSHSPTSTTVVFSGAVN